MYTLCLSVSLFPLCIPSVSLSLCLSLLLNQATSELNYDCFLTSTQISFTLFIFIFFFIFIFIFFFSISFVLTSTQISFTLFILPPPHTRTNTHTHTHILPISPRTIQSLATAPSWLPPWSPPPTSPSPPSSALPIFPCFPALSKLCCARPGDRDWNCVRFGVGSPGRNCLGFRFRV